MKTLKQLAIVALACYGSAAMAADKQEFWILNKSSYEITVITNGRAKTQEKIAAGQASSFSEIGYEIQSKYANGIITIIDDSKAQYAKFNKDGSPAAAKPLDIKNKNVIVVDVGVTTGFAVTALTAADAKKKYPKAGITAIELMTPEQVKALIKSKKTDAKTLAQLESDLNSRTTPLENLKFASKQGIPYTLVPLDKNLKNLSEEQILKLTNAELYRIFGFDKTPSGDDLLAYMRYDRAERHRLIFDTLVGDSSTAKQKVFKLVLLGFEISVLVPRIEEAIEVNANR
jgi:hypothetical protein